MVRITNWTHHALSRYLVTEPSKPKKLWLMINPRQGWHPPLSWHLGGCQRQIEAGWLERCRVACCNQEAPQLKPMPASMPPWCPSKFYPLVQTKAYKNARTRSIEPTPLPRLYAGFALTPTINCEQHSHKPKENRTHSWNTMVNMRISTAQSAYLVQCNTVQVCP